MGNKSLALVYRPKKFDEVTEQQEIVSILQNQIDTDSVRGAYCFVGAAGTGKTTCARIFANEINKGMGSPIEMDAASHNGVDDVREIAELAKTQSIEAKYKVFILDEAHMFSAGAWAAMLKLIEEPPARCVFILCTTDYWKIPKTIQSRCQRYDFKRISTQGIVDRLAYILDEENTSNNKAQEWLPAINYIAKLADGCLRDAITTMDKCLSFNDELTIDNVIQALGLSHLDVFRDLTDKYIHAEEKAVLELLEKSYSDGADMKQFIKDYTLFILDVCKYLITESFDYISLPQTMKGWLDGVDANYDDMLEILDMLVELDGGLKYDSNPLYTIEAKFMLAGR